MLHIASDDDYIAAHYLFLRTKFKERHADQLVTARVALAKGNRAWAAQCFDRARFYRNAIRRMPA